MYAKREKYILFMFQKIIQIILLIIPNGEKCKTKSKEGKAMSIWQWWYYLVVKELSVLLRGIVSKKIMVICVVWIVFILLDQKTNLNCIRLCENKHFCNVTMRSEDTDLLELINTKNLIKQYLLFM